MATEINPKVESRVTRYLKTPIPTKKRNPEIEGLIQEGLSMAEIGRRLNLSREWIRQYLIRNSLYDIWYANVELTQKYCKKSVKKHKYYEDIMLSVALRAYELAEQQGPAYVKAIDYFLNKHKTYNSTPLEKIISLFTAHETAQQSGIELTLQQLSKKSDINYKSTIMILKEVGLSYKNQKQRLTKEKKKVIIKARRLGTPIRDIAFFSKVSSATIRKIINHDKGKVKYRDYNKQRRKTPYRTSSQIYEAQDLGFTIEEISELLDINTRRIKRAFEKREIYEKRIITILNTLYPQEQHNKPYLTNNLL